MRVGFSVEHAFEQRLIGKGIRHIRALEPRPAIVEPHLALSTAQPDALDMLIRVEQPAGDQKGAAVRLKDIVDAQSHRNGKGRDRLAPLEAVGGRTQPEQNGGRAVRLKQHEADMPGRVRRTGDQPVLMNRSVAPAPAPAIDEPLDVSCAKRFAGRQQTDEACATLRSVLPGEGRDPTVGNDRIFAAHNHASVAGVGGAGPPSEEDRSLVGLANELEEAVATLSGLRQGNNCRKPSPAGRHLHHRIHERVQHVGQLGAGKLREDRHALANRKRAGGRRYSAWGYSPDPGGGW
ncbi:hypothetical protein Q1M64_10385 (plasmid) [Sinorhizobium meliloti]|nr:hypothetical protein Q1M64_10385 [Sinorhizobium meliloti]